ncbi:MAG TPA: class I SAM-dependent methyltransferase [Chitinophagales bacterium]|nr:class I SAM-dependent methyltransferase [Chitinophagales bacterium]HQO31948.1 class I SAM-dependent methyltransferase [Chitinophagales bacterium]
MSEEKKQWFELWFDSPLYHILYKNRNQEEANLFMDNVIRHLEIDFGSILDLACGKGRHAYYLAEKGFDVVGLDLSKESIQYANTMYQLPNLEFYVHDMRLPFRINYFDYIFNLFTSLGYFDSLKENEKVFQSMHAGLKDNGYILIDFMNTEKVIHNLVPREKKDIDGYTFYIRREVENGKIVKNIHIEKEDNVWMYKEEVQVLMQHHFHTFLNNTGFTLVREFGDYQLNPFNVKTSDRYILLARKNS